MIDGATRNKSGNALKYDRRIIIVTDGQGNLDTGDLEQMGSKLKEDGASIDLVVLGADFDDAESGYKEEDKEADKVRHSD